jgi:hypothetical protein
LVATPTRPFGPYLGDYVHLIAQGKDFYGIFSAENAPILANFPAGVTYQRNHNFATNALLDTDGTTAVATSIDPFFFKATGLAAASDFYVRDWTDSPASGDSGLEPSTHAVFYATSDVWNKRTNVAGAFNANNQPVNENPSNGTSPAGENFAFARVFRNAPGAPSQTVTAQFLFSEFGTGSNFQMAGSAAGSTIVFNPADTSLTMTSGHPWHLDPTSSTHLCLAVEISTPDDPFVPPSLLGRAPGWPTTDLVVLNDNNKAQRNMGVYPASGAGAVTYYAIAHNAATFVRDLSLRYTVDREVLPKLRAQVGVVGDRVGQAPLKPTDVLTLRQMQPGENRWVALTLEAPSDGQPGVTLPVQFAEVVGGHEVSGFGIALQPAPIAEVAGDLLEFHRSVFTRLAAQFNASNASDEATHAQELLEKAGLAGEDLVGFAKARANTMATALADVLKVSGGTDPFETKAAAKALEDTIAAGEVGRVLNAHSALLHKLDAFATMLQKSRGDAADIIQNVAWQRDLFSVLARSSNAAFAVRVVDESQRFLDKFAGRTDAPSVFPSFLASLIDAFQATDQFVNRPEIGLRESIAALAPAATSPAASQRAHREFLLKLDPVLRPVPAPSAEDEP